MRLIDLSFDDPAQNLALDEALLDAAEEGRSGDTLRFWESPSTFVVLGTAQVFAIEVHEAACRRDGVPVLRRCSAGGCVLQGPGSLNYSLVLCLENAAPALLEARGQTPLSADTAALSGPAGLVSYVAFAVAESLVWLSVSLASLLFGRLLLRRASLAAAVTWLVLFAKASGLPPSK